MKTIKYVDYDKLMTLIIKKSRTAKKFCHDNGFTPAQITWLGKHITKLTPRMSLRLCTALNCEEKDFIYKG